MELFFHSKEEVVLLLGRGSSEGSFIKEHTQVVGDQPHGHM